MEHQRGVLAHLALLAEVVGLDVQQEVGEVDHHQQGELALAAINHAEGAAQQQEQGRQHVEQRQEELAQLPQARHGQAGQQQWQGGQQMVGAVGA